MRLLQELKDFTTIELRHPDFIAATKSKVERICEKSP
jgi:hypothetical protein